MKALSKRQQAKQNALAGMKKRGKRPPPPIRKPRHSKKKILEALRATGGFVSYAAAKLEVHESTIHRAIGKFPDLKAELEHIRNGHLDMAEHSLIKQVKSGNTSATIFMLKCLGKPRGYIEQPQQANLHLHAGAGAADGSGTWADIMRRQLKSGKINRHTGQIIDAEFEDAPKALKA